MQLLERIKQLECQIKGMKQHFGLNWQPIPETFDNELEKFIPILEEDANRAISSKDGKPTHIIIEGDNFHALTCLNYTHYEDFDIIYIDPPYNTGSDSFIFKDSRFIDTDPNGKTIPKNDPQRHSKWISFIEKRLRLARNLLKNSGIIFISIGQDELAQLILLCNQIFREQNQLGIISRVQKKGSDKGQFFSPSIDYVLVYAKDKSKAEAFSEPIKAKFDKLETKGLRKGEYYEDSKSLYQASLDSRPNQRYYIKCPDGSFVIPPGYNFPKKVADGSMVKPKDNEDKCWRWKRDAYLSKKDYIVIRKSTQSPLLNENGDPSPWNVYVKRYQSDAEEKGNVPSDFIDDCINTLGTNRLRKMGLKFSFSKPCELIKKLIAMTDKGQDIKVLDFFAGSGTTMDAILQMNAESGNRQCVLVQSSENDICKKILYPRIKKAIKGFKEKSRKQRNVKGLGGSLKYYKTAFIPKDANVKKNGAKRFTDSDRIRLAQKAGNLLSLCENTLEPKQVSKKHSKYFQIFTDGKSKHTAVYFNVDVSEFEAFVTKIKTIQENDLNANISVYIFCWGEVESFEAEFDNLDGLTFKSIPQPILDAYKEIYR